MPKYLLLSITSSKRFSNIPSAIIALSEETRLLVHGIGRLYWMKTPANMRFTTTLLQK